MPYNSCRLRMLMIGVTNEAWKEVGYLRIPRTECILIFAPMTSTVSKRTFSNIIVYIWTGCFIEFIQYIYIGAVE